MHAYKLQRRFVCRGPTRTDYSDITNAGLLLQYVVKDDSESLIPKAIMNIHV